MSKETLNLTLDKGQTVTLDFNRSQRIKGEVLHKGVLVPVEVEITLNWLGLPGIVVHVPKDYKDSSDLMRWVDFQSDLDKNVRLLEDLADKKIQ